MRCVDDECEGTEVSELSESIRRNGRSPDTTMGGSVSGPVHHTTFFQSWVVVVLGPNEEGKLRPGGG